MGFFGTKKAGNRDSEAVSRRESEAPSRSTGESRREQNGGRHRQEHQLLPHMNHSRNRRQSAGFRTVHKESLSNRLRNRSNPVTPIITACLDDQTEKAKQLILDGSQVNEANAFLTSALSMACIRNLGEIVTLLIEHGADLDSPDMLGWNPLMYACYFSQDEVVEELVGAGAKLNQQSAVGRLSALMICCRESKWKLAELLVNKGALVEKYDSRGWTALMYAAKTDNVEIASLLISKGAKQTPKSIRGETALMIACMHGQAEMAEFLIKNGAEINAKDERNRSALMLACQFKLPEVALLLVKKGADVNLVEEDGWTALMYACCYGEPEIVKVLIENGAEVDRIEHQGWTAIMLSALNALPTVTKESMFACFKQCYIAGASFNYKNNVRETVTTIAHRCERDDIESFVAYLRSSPVADLLLGDLELPRVCIVTFFDNDILTLEDCAELTDSDLQELALDKVMYRKRFMNRVKEKLEEGNNESSSRHLTESKGPAPPRASESLRKRVSRRLSRVLSRKNSIGYDAFLTHDWGLDELDRDNHMRVSKVNGMLKDRGLRTWFDEDKLLGNIAQQISDGIDRSKKILVFVTHRYMEKLRKDDLDYCRDEFLMSVQVHSPKNMIPVIMEPRMLDTKTWRGPLQLSLGTHLYIDFSSDRKIERNFHELMSRLDD